MIVFLLAILLIGAIYMSTSKFCKIVETMILAWNGAIILSTIIRN
jgi:hypothetical protein